MTKKHDTEAEHKAALEKINDPDRPELPSTLHTPNPEVLSHNWQRGSPAHDLSYPGVKEKAVNTVALAEQEEEKAKKPKKEQVSQAEYDRRIKLPDSDPEYINPSLDHHEVK